MVFVCNRCNFAFTRHIEPKLCPNCEREAVRQATEAESLKFMERIVQRPSDTRKQESA